MSVWDVLLQRYFKVRDGRRNARLDFAKIIAAIKQQGIINDLSADLMGLKHVLDTHPEFLKKSENREFYNKWLSHPLLSEGYPVINSQTDFTQMKSELSKLRP